MKRKFLLLVAFFLSSCASTDFRKDSGCPVGVYGRHLTVLFEYGSAELNEKAVRQLEEIASQAGKSGDYVCFLGRLSYGGVASDQALGALDRVKNTAAIFLQEGVPLEKIYIGIAPQEDNTGFSQPLIAEEEQHILEILTGR